MTGSSKRILTRRGKTSPGSSRNAGAMGSRDLRIFFHVYKFNEDEVDPCKKFANRLGILFHPQYAILNRWDDLKKLVTGEIPPETFSDISGDLHGLEEIPRFKDRGRGAPVPLPAIRIPCPYGERGCRYLLPASKDRPEFLCGNILNDTLADILERRQKMPVCEDCVGTGLASYIASSIKVPASYRRGLRQTVLLFERKLRRVFSGRW